MLVELSDYWHKSTFKQKLGLFRQIVLELVVIAVGGFIFFWFTFIFTWLMALLIGVEPYLQTFSPIFHVRNLMPDSLLTIFVNHNMKRQACEMGPDHLFFSELTVPYHEYCNIQQLPLPPMKAPVGISILGVDVAQVAYVTSCIKHLGREVSCQKYPSSQSLLLFRSVEFYGLYYLQIELHLKKMSDPTSLSQSPQIQFEEQCWLLTRFIKKYYGLFVIIFSYGITALLTIAIIAIRLAAVGQSISQKNQSSLKSLKASGPKLISQSVGSQRVSTMGSGSNVVQNSLNLPSHPSQATNQRQTMIRESDPRAKISGEREKNQ